jgi:hypothetical protein
MLQLFTNMIIQIDRNPLVVLIFGPPSETVNQWYNVVLYPISASQPLSEGDVARDSFDAINEAVIESERTVLDTDGALCGIS